MAGRTLTVTWQSRDGSILRYRLEGAIAEAVASMPAREQDFLFDILYRMARSDWHTHRWRYLEPRLVAEEARKEGKIDLPPQGQVAYFALMDALALQDEP